MNLLLLTPQETNQLKNSLEISNEDEKTIVFITHKLKEIKELQKLSLLKNGHGC